MSNKTFFLSVSLCLLICFVFTIQHVSSQQPNKHISQKSERHAATSTETEQFLKDLLESLAENLSEDYDLSEITERLVKYHKHPIDLNNTSKEVLEDLFFLTPLQIGSFFNYLRTHGSLIDLLELQRIDGFDVITVQRLLHFVYIKQPNLLANRNPETVFNNSNHDLMLKYGQLLQQRKGYKKLPGSRYLGTPEKLLLRYRYSYADILLFGLVMEKDPGERRFNQKTISDHLSASLSVQHLGRIKKLVIGDYSLQFGQGLSLWSGFVYGKGPDVTSVAARDTGLKPYSSSNESSFFRGLASIVDLTKNINITSFVSHRKLDASLKILPDGSTTLSNINISGLHRTATELKNQRSLSQTIYGSALSYRDQQFTIAALAYQSDYEHPFSTGSAAYNRYSFIGRHLTNFGINYHYSYRNYYFYGETAHSLNSGWAVLHGAMASLSLKWSAVLVHRKYDKDYHTFFGQAIGEGTEVTNEEGLYAGINFMPNARWTLSVYGDYFRFPWLKYRVDSASRGREWLMQITFIPHKRFKAQIRFKTELKQQNPDAGSKRSGLENVRKETFRLECNWSPEQKINLQSRAECSSYQKGPLSKEYGFLLYQDLNYKPTSARISGNVRLAWFRIPSYNSRMYAYEDDVLYGASSALYYGNGLRSFFNIRYRLMRKMDIWGRYAIFLYKDQEIIGSGLDQVIGNKKSDIKLQLRYQF